MIYFPEYQLGPDYNGHTITPHLKNGEWYIGSEHVSLTRLGILCKIDKQELTLLKLTYGG